MTPAYGQSETKYNEQESDLTNHLFLRSNRSVHLPIASNLN